jgi:hypothetical protein
MTEKTIAQLEAELAQAKAEAANNQQQAGQQPQAEGSITDMLDSVLGGATGGAVGGLNKAASATGKRMGYGETIIKSIIRQFGTRIVSMVLAAMMGKKR